MKHSNCYIFFLTNLIKVVPRHSLLLNYSILIDISGLKQQTLNTKLLRIVHRGIRRPIYFVRFEDCS